MEMLKKYFPYSFGAKDLTALIIKIIVMVVVDAVAGVLIGLLAALPIIGVIIGLVGGLVGLYFLIGIVLAILDYFKILK